MAQTRDVLAAGAVVMRKREDGKREVLLVHRPRYDDWSFPKGKLDRGEGFAVAAVREVEEETGLRVRLGVPLSDQTYQAQRRTKRVAYWVARVVAGDVGDYQPNQEIDDLAWVPVKQAPEHLTYDRDRDTLAEAVELRRATQTVLVLRHGKSRARKGWTHDDRLRPLLVDGVEQAGDLVPVIGAYDITRVVSSSSTRCVQTVTPYAAGRQVPLELTHGLSEEDGTDTGIRQILEEVLAAGHRTLVCVHRPLLSAVLATLGVADTRLEPGGFVVVHHRDGEAVAIESP